MITLDHFKRFTPTPIKRILESRSLLPLIVVGSLSGCAHANGKLNQPCESMHLDDRQRCREILNGEMDQQLSHQTPGTRYCDKENLRKLIRHYRCQAARLKYLCENPRPEIAFEDIPVPEKCIPNDESVDEPDEAIATSSPATSESLHDGH